MGLKSTLKLLLLFCSLNLILNQDEQRILGPDSPVEINDNRVKGYQITLATNLTEYITIKFSMQDNSMNPVVLVGTDSGCRQRITMADQRYGLINIFLRAEQFEEISNFYVCIANRKSEMDVGVYKIEITNNEKAILPIDQQASYYVGKKNTEMKIIFTLPEGRSGNEFTFWARGKNIVKAHMEDYEPETFNGATIFIGKHSLGDIIMTVLSTEGDYVTIGSTTVVSSQATYQNLTINGNEITVGSINKEICFHIDFDDNFSAITGKLYTLKGKTTFKNSLLQLIYENEITDGIISDYNDIKTKYGFSDGYYCVSSDQKIILTIQMISFDDRIIVTPPAIPGDIRRYIMKKGDMAIFSAMTPTFGAKTLNFNMKSLKGFPDLYGERISTFPFFSISEEYLQTKTNFTINNRFATYIYHLDKPYKEGEDVKEINYLTKEQPLIYVHCPKGSSSQYSNNKFCEIEVSIFTNMDTIFLAEERSFSQYLDEGEKNIYKIIFPKELKLNSKIYIDLTPFTGDAEINIVSYGGGKYNNYYLSNKVFCIIEYDKTEVKHIQFTIQAKKNVFYMVYYYYMYYQAINEDKNSLESGVNYITSKDVTDKNQDKSVYLKNFRYEDRLSYFASFYSPNCEFKVTLNLKEQVPLVVPQYDNYAHIIMDLNDDKYYQDNYHFIYNIEKFDGTKYPNKFCMVYAAGLELENQFNWNGRSISLSEGVPHIFAHTQKSRYSHYSYYILNRNNSVVINFNLIDKAYFKVYLRINRTDLEPSYDLYINKQISISSEKLKNRCLEPEICKLDIMVEYQDLTESKEEKKVEINVYQLDQNPVYLEKNRVTNDFINGNSAKHYYFDISNKEYGDITLDFKRGSGKIYAIVQTRREGTPVPNADWRGVYKFPDAKTPDLLEYRDYGKKLIISKTDTSICGNGCYVLITVQSNRDIPQPSDDRDIPSPSDDINYPFRISLNARTIPKDVEQDNPVVKISLDNFIIGDITMANEENRKYDFYQVELTHDSNEIHLDFQSDNSYLLINFGEVPDPPKFNEMPYQLYPPVGDNVYSFPRSEILYEALRQQTDTLKGIIMTIGIYSNITDSLKSTPYAFKVFEPPLARENEKIASELIHINSDQRVQCSPLLLEKKYPVCIFAVLFDDNALKKNLILYPRTNSNKPIYKYGRKMKATTIETYDVNQILELTVETYHNSEKYYKPDDFIFEPSVDNTDAYFLIIWTEDPESIIDVLSSTYAFSDDMNFTPNPSTHQLFALQQHYINIVFPTNEDLLLNINSVNDKGKFNWNEGGEAQSRELFLRGRDDRLSLTTYKYDDILPKLKVTSLSTNDTNAGFVFYIRYYPRNYMDKLQPNTMGEVHYRTVEMPLGFFSRINIIQPWIVNLNFYDIIPKGDSSLVYENELFDIWGTVLPESQIYKAINDKRYRPDPSFEDKIQGKFDAFYGIIFFSTEFSTKIMINYPLENPYIYFNIDDIGTYQYETIGLEANVRSVNEVSGTDFTPEGVYITGKLSLGSEDKKKIYKLRLNKNNPYLRLEFSSNSIYVKYALTFDFNSETTDVFDPEDLSEESGRKVLKVGINSEILKNNNFIYLIVFAEKSVEESSLDYFVFKYLTSNDLNSFISIKDLVISKINVVETEIDKTKKLLTISLDPIKQKNTTYLIKAIYTVDYIRGENVNSIAMSESGGKNMLVNVGELPVSEKTFNLEVPSNKEVLYVKVMAMFSKDEEKIIYLYTPYDVSENREAPTVQLKRTDKIQNITLTSKFRKISAEMNDEEGGAYKKQKYQVIFDDKDLLLKYVKVEVTNEDEYDENPTLCISKEDPDCMEQRIQLVKGDKKKKSTEIFVKKEQILDHFFFTVEYYNAENCTYTINITKQHEATFSNFDKFNYYNYYVSKENTDMVFKFNNKNEDLNCLLTVYATGGKNIKLNFANCNNDICLQHTFTYGAGITAIVTGLEYYSISVTAQAGDYISLGTKYFKNKDDNIFEISQETGQITGVLRRSVLNEECYTLPLEEGYNTDTYYLTGRIFDDSANIRLFGSNAFKSNFELPIDLHKTENGFFYALLNMTNGANKLCFNISKDNLYSAYSVQIQRNTNYNGNVFLPQNPPISYQRIIPKGKIISLNSILPKSISKYLVYNMIVKLGYPKMYIYDCDTYPSCPVNETDIDSNPNIKRISDMNGMSSYFSSEALYQSPIDANQKLLIFKCNDANGEGKYEYCEVISTIFGDNEPIQLIDKQPFSRYNTPEDTNQYLIDVSSVKENWFKIYIDLLVVSGDVSVDIKNADNYEAIDANNANKYYLSNKIFYTITVDRNENKNENLKKILIDTRSKVSSYYIVEYKLISAQNEELNKNHVRAGINYLVPLVESQDAQGNLTKKIEIESIKIIKPKIFIASFYSLNCNFEVVKDNQEKIQSFGRYAQDFYDYQESDEVMTKHSYTATVVDKQSIYHNDMCMLYVSGVEFYADDSNVRKEILVSEGVPQRMIFDEHINKTRYVFPHAEPGQNLTCSINMIVPGKFKIKLFFREQEYNIDKDTYTQSGIFYIYNEWIQTHCNANYERCSITVELEKIETFNNEPPVIEFSIKKVKNTPYYFPRGIQKKDYITNDAYLFLYTDVGKDDIGYVTFDFNRGSGYAYGKIVNAYQTESVDGADWRNYKFIRYKDEQSLEYDFYNKKINFSDADTTNCKNGCFILISVVSSVIKAEIPTYDFQTFNILAAFSPIKSILSNKIDKIEIVPDEFIIGSFNKYYVSIDEYSENYTLICPYDAEAIEIDWQTNIVALNVEIDDYKNNYSNNGSSLITINKEDILGPENNTSLKNKELKLRASTKTFEEFGFSIYSFRVHFKRNESVNIHKVTSDQKVICTPNLIEVKGEYRCLFVVIYKEQEIFKNLMIYPKSQEPAARLNSFAKFISGEIYDRYDVDNLRTLIPNQENADYSTIKSKTDFLFIENGEFQSYAYISVISDKPNDIELLTSFKTFELLIEPNPRSPQVYSVDLRRESIHINFMTKQGLSINVMSLYGEARYSFDHDKDISFYLKGADDNLNYAVKAVEEDRPNTGLNVENLRYNDLNYKNPGCAFVLEFFLRSPFVELDSIRIGETKEMVYKDLPYNTDIYYYTKVTDKSKDIAGFFYLHDLEYTETSAESRLIYTGEILFKAMIVTEDRITKIKDGTDKIPTDFYLEGVYDATLKAGSIYVDKTNFTVYEYDNPVLLVAIRKNEKSNLGFKRFRGEIGFNYVNSEAPVIQKSYQFGKIGGPEDIVSYKLKTDSKISNYVRVQFSTNSEFVDFSISKEKAQRTNGTFNETLSKRQRGITFVTITRPNDTEYLYLNIFLKSDSKNRKLNNYVFKYMNALDKEEFTEFKIMHNNPRINVQRVNFETFKVVFCPINYEPSLEDDLITNILYNIKIVPTNTYIPKEKTDLIAITESPSIAKQFKHISKDNRTVEIKDFGIVENYSYAQIVAAITRGSYIEYVTYQAVDSNNKVIDPTSNPDPGEPDYPPSPVKPTDSDKPTTDKNKNALIAIIVVSCVLFVVVVVLIVVIVRYNSKNKDLLTQVNKISFVQSGASAKDDANLLLDNQNELD